ncbi:dynein beta chain, ciliary protein [Tasmannia lanceolata]|uniref:dynein beta chain, ciliary protein n=1 Tax=Tasmannia lanceolata TaxID=3420 RepID=UPI0040647B52
MGQALRRATGRVRSSSLNQSAQVKNVEQQPRAVDTKILKNIEDRIGVPDSESIPSVQNVDNVLEERDPGYDAMLNKMVGRITTKPGGKLEMGEALIVERDKRPMPKLRSTREDAIQHEQKPVPSGTLNLTQVKQILLLHQGKADDHDGPMDAHGIAEKFRVDIEHVQRILQFVSLPPEDNSRKKDEQCRWLD